MAFALLCLAGAELAFVGMWSWTRSGFGWEAPVMLGGAVALFVVALVGLQRTLTGGRTRWLLGLGFGVLVSVWTCVALLSE